MAVLISPGAFNVEIVLKFLSASRAISVCLLKAASEDAVVVLEEAIAGIS